MTTNALSFDGTNEGIIVPKGADIDNIFAGGGIVKIKMNTNSSINLGYNRIVVKAGISITYASYPAAYALYINVATSGNNGIWYCNFATPIGTEFELTIEWNSTTLSTPVFKYDEVVKSTMVVQSPTGTYTTDAGADLVLFNRSSMDRPYKGVVSNVELINQGTTKMLLEFDEQSGATVLDTSANSNDGTISNYDIKMRVYVDEGSSSTSDMFLMF